MLNTKFTKIKNNIHDTPNLDKKTAFAEKATDIKNKIPHITLISKTNFNTKVTEIENEVASTTDFVK